MRNGGDGYFMQMVRFVVAASAVGIACSVAASGVSAQATAALTSPTYEATLAGPSLAPMYSSGLIYAASWPGTTDGALVVADTGDNRISVFDPSTCPNPDTSVCAPILKFGVLGSAAGDFSTPRDVAVDAADNIYVVDTDNSRIEAFNDTGTFLWQAGGLGKAANQLNVPIGISYDATTNEVLVADTGHSAIKAFAAVGGVPASGGLGPFAAGAYIWKSPSGILKSPREARRGPDGEIWVADYHNEKVEAFQCTCTTSSTTWNTTPNKVIGDGLPQGHASGEVNSPYNIAFSPNGQIGYVSDTGNERIGVFNITNCTGTLNGQVNECPPLGDDGSRCPKVCPPSPGNAGYFIALRRVAVDPQGNIWASDFWGSGIHEFSPSIPTSAETEIDGNPAPAPGFAEAYGIAVGPASGGGWLAYGVDRLNQRVEEFSDAAPPNNLLAFEGERGVALGDYSWPEAVAVDPSGNVWVGDTRNNRLEEYSANLTTPSAVTGNPTVGAFNHIEGVSVAANGIVWIADTDNNRVVSYNPTNGAMVAFGTRGTSTTVGAPVQVINPEGVVVSGTDIYIADTGNNRVDEVDMSGDLVATYATGLDGPEGIALAPDGTVWVANTQDDQIVQLSSDLSTELMSFGSSGTGSLQFDLPHSLAVSPNGTTLFVADTYNNRVQEFNISGS
jgi:DNA-binding beta-propeller fold protein YncE